MQIFKMLVFLLASAQLTMACYWATMKASVTLDGIAQCGAAAWMQVVYRVDSLYTFAPQCGNIDKTYYGHCDPICAVTYFAKGYYQKSELISDHCVLTNLGSHPAPEPVYLCQCTVNLESGPTAVAGKDHWISIYLKDTLDGSQSQSYGGRSIIKYHWSARLNMLDTATVTSVHFNDSTAARPWVMLMIPGDYNFYLCVEDEHGLSDWDTVKVHACPYGQPCVEGIENSAGDPGPFPVLAYPNPFDGGVRIYLPSPAEEVFIHDISGRRIRHLKARTAQDAFWDGKDMTGKPAAKGIYFAVLRPANGPVLISTPLLKVR